MSQFPNSLPGIGTSSTLTLTPRTIFIVDTTTGDFLPAGAIIDGQSARDPQNPIRTDELRAGLVLGKVTTTAVLQSATSGMYAAAILGTLTNAFLGGTTTSGTVSTAVATELVRRSGGTSGSVVLTGTGSVSGAAVTQTVAFSNCVVATGVITLTAPATSIKVGALLGVPDGSYTPVTLEVGPYPIRVTDINGTNQATPLPLIPVTHKTVDVNQIINYPSYDTVLTAWLKTQLRVVCPALTFSDDF